MPISSTVGAIQISKRDKPSADLGDVLLLLGEEDGDVQDERHLGHVGGLEGDRPQFEPALRAVRHDAEHLYSHEKCERAEHRHLREPRQLAVVEQRQPAGRGKGQPHANEVPEQEPLRVAAGLGLGQE